jgi:cyanophycin synthetase
MGIKILELRALRGPNRYSKRKTIFMLLDIEEFEFKPSNEIPDFTERLVEMIPSLVEHKCSIGEPGGFIQRLKNGTYIPHIIEHIAIELQCLAGTPVKFGKAYETEQEGVYVVVFHYVVESIGLEAAEEAIWLVESIIYNEKYNIKQTVQILKELREEDKLGPTTQSLVDEAVARGIPYFRLNSNSYVQLGYGKYQKRIQASMTSQTSALAVEIADEKARTKEILKTACIPVPDGEVVYTIEEADDLIRDIEFPVAVKPEVGNHGRGISVNINDLDALEKAFNSAKKVYESVIIEQYIEGNDYRILVIDGKLTAAAHRVPPHVIGDGKSTIEELIKIINTDSRRGFGHENVLTRIKIDEMTERLLNNKGVKVTDILPKDERVYLKTTANLSQGGTSIDVTDIIHPEIRLMAERTARIVGMDCIGIDFICTDISKSIHEQKCGVVEVNAAPGLRMHLQPSEGKPRNVAIPFIDMLFPPEDITSMPTIAVTGTNGKTTTSKLITHTLKYNGKIVGLATTTGVEIDGIPIVSGDYSGPSGHALVLRDATVDHAVLECARGAIIRRGLAFDRCDVGIFLNVGEDHIGNDLVESVEDLSMVKSIVVEVVKDTGTSVLNAENELVMSHLHRAKGNQILFSIDPENQHIIKHIEAGKTVVTVVNDNIVIKSNDFEKIVCAVHEVPITFGGAADFNISNTLAAVAALHGLGFKREKICNGISTFYPSSKQNPGRMNVFGFNRAKVILDYGHNRHAIEALATVLPKLTDKRKIVVCFGTGSRTDDALQELGNTVAGVYDHIIVADPDPRRREPGETSTIVENGILEKGFNKENIVKINNFHDAVDHALNIVQDDELVVIQVDEDVQPLIDQMMERKKGEFFSYSGM